MSRCRMMSPKTVREAIERAYGSGVSIERINEAFKPDYGWYAVGRAYRSFGSLYMGLLDLQGFDQVNIQFLDQFGVTHNADFARSEFS